MTDQLYIRCPDCNGMGSVSVMNGQGRETELQCERCANDGGYVPVDEVRLSRVEWEATIDYLAMIVELELRRADGDVPIHIQLNEDDLRAAVDAAVKENKR